jgi:hypothetical protein
MHQRQHHDTTTYVDLRSEALITYLGLEYYDSSSPDVRDDGLIAIAVYTETESSSNVQVPTARRLEVWVDLPPPATRHQAVDVSPRIKGPLALDDALGPAFDLDLENTASVPIRMLAAVPIARTRDLDFDSTARPASGQLTKFVRACRGSQRGYHHDRAQK